MLEGHALFVSIDRRGVLEDVLKGATMFDGVLNNVLDSVLALLPSA